MKHERVVLAIDPSFVSAGYAILRSLDRRVMLCECDTLRQKSTQSIEARLLTFSDFFNAKIIEYGVTDLCLETPFLGKNAQNFLKLGYLRGALLLHAARFQLTLHQLSPREIKMQVAGYGGADKEQVARAVLRFFPMLVSSTALVNDATDALALAFCVITSHSF